MVYGARPVKRYLQKHVETALAGELIKGNIVEGDAVVMDYDGNELVFNVR